MSFIFWFPSLWSCRVYSMSRPFITSRYTHSIQGLVMLLTLDCVFNVLYSVGYTIGQLDYSIGLPYTTKIREYFSTKDRNYWTQYFGKLPHILYFKSINIILTTTLALFCYLKPNSVNFHFMSYKAVSKDMFNLFVY